MCLIKGYRQGAELGVSTGRFSTFLCATIPDLTMIAVDLWAEQEARDEEGSETFAGWPHERKYQALTRFVAEHYPDRITIHRMHTVEAAKLVPDDSLDFVFIDADHSYSGVKADYEAWFPKVRAGGTIFGHDYDWPTVKRFVDELPHKIIIATDRTWLHTK